MTKTENEILNADKAVTRKQIQLQGELIFLKEFKLPVSSTKRFGILMAEIMQFISLS